MIAGRYLMCFPPDARNLRDIRGKTARRERQLDFPDILQAIEHQNPSLSAVCSGGGVVHIRIL
jgi:hypothetical protein